MGRRVRRRRCNFIAALGLLLGPLTDPAAATPAEKLLGEMLPDIAEPSLRCDWIAGHFDRIDRTLSLYRDELSTLIVASDGATLADSKSGGILRAVFETRLHGPPVAVVALDPARVAGADRLRPGARLEVAFLDSGGAAHPLFCGRIALADASASLLQVTALQPNVGTEARATATFFNLSHADMLRQLAQQAGLGLRIDDPLASTRPAFWMLRRDDQAAWPFMRGLAAADRLELTLPAQGTIVVTPTSFVEPVRALQRRNWQALTWAEIAVQIAGESGRKPDAQLKLAYPRLDRVQQATNDDFLSDISVDAAASAYFAPGRLLLREDGAWRRNAAAYSAPAMNITPGELATQITKRHRLPLRMAAVVLPAVSVVQADETDAEVLLRVLGANLLHWSRGKDAMVVRAARAPGDVTDLLLRRVVVTGSAATSRSFKRVFADVQAQLLDPEGVAVTEIQLDLGSAMRSTAASPPRILDAASVAYELEQAIARLGAASAVTPYDRFLLEVARTYRPTLIQLYRTQPDGLRRLTALQP